MALKVYSIEEKLAVIHVAIIRARELPRAPGSNAQRHYDILKAIAEDLRSRLELPRNQTLGELHRLLQKMKDAPREGREYSHDRVLPVINCVVHHWPVIQLALEQYGELSSE
jgi:hypothetical protein